MRILHKTCSNHSSVSKSRYQSILFILFIFLNFRKAVAADDFNVDDVSDENDDTDDDTEDVAAAEVLVVDAMVLMQKA